MSTHSACFFEEIAAGAAGAEVFLEESVYDDGEDGEGGGDDTEGYLGDGPGVEFDVLPW